jgi:hypothetical protein
MVDNFPKITKMQQEIAKACRITYIRKTNERVWCRWHTIFHRRAVRDDRLSVMIPDPQI